MHKDFEITTNVFFFFEMTKKQYFSKKVKINIIELNMQMDSGSYVAFLG